MSKVHGRKGNKLGAWIKKEPYKHKKNEQGFNLNSHFICSFLFQDYQTNAKFDEGVYHVFSPFAFFANYPLTSKRSHPKAQRHRHIKYFLCLTFVRNCFPVVVGCSVILCCALLDKVLTSQQKHLGDTWGFWCPVTMFVWLMGVVRMISTLAAYSLFFIFAEFGLARGMSNSFLT